MDHVARSVHLPRPAAEVWELVGAFQGLPNWHPAVEASHEERREGIEHRRLVLVGGGGEILERLLGFNERSYAYEILESPLPVADYRAAITVAEAGDGTVVTWSASFSPAGSGASEVIAGIFEAGLGTLRQKFGG